MANFPTFQDLISHRFRGFSKFENTIEGLESAMACGVKNLEFDIRITRCGTPIVYHDEYACAENGTTHYLHTLDFSNYAELGGVFSHIPTLENLLSHAAKNANKTAKLLIDIKEFGLHEAIHALVCSFRLQDRVIYVSWLPEVLYALDTITPQTPKCFSHWCGSVNTDIQASHTVHTSRHGNVPLPKTPQTIGSRSGWQLNAPIIGEMLDVLKRSNGGICVPENMITRHLSEYYHNNDLFVSTFSYVKTKEIIRAKNDFNIDFYFVDKKIVFDDLL